MVGSYVWDYAGGRSPRALFWDVAVALDPAAAELDERTRYPICQADQLERLFRNAGINAVESGAIDLDAEFQNFDDYWMPFLAGYGPASAYLLSLAPGAQERLRAGLRAALTPADDQPFTLPIRALSVRGVK